MCVNQYLSEAIQFFFSKKALKNAYNKKFHFRKLHTINTYNKCIQLQILFEKIVSNNLSNYFYLKF